MARTRSRPAYARSRELCMCSWCRAASGRGRLQKRRQAAATRDTREQVSESGGDVSWSGAGWFRWSWVLGHATNLDALQLLRADAALLTSREPLGGEDHAVG